MKKTASLAILEQLAQEQRRILSIWRAVVLLRRATFAIPPGERRWTSLPDDATDLAPLLRQMRQRGELEPVKDSPQIYEATVPYARTGIIDEEEILLEMNPYAVLSHLTAFVFHGLTEELPKGFTVTSSLDSTGELLPLGTEPRDWEGVALPSGRRPTSIRGRPVHWTRVKPERFFGFSTYQPHGYLLRVTNLERTLLDGLQTPELCGGIASVLGAWLLARHSLDVDALVHQVDRFNIAILRQRVGFVLEEIGLSHPVLEQWRDQAKRGGSSKLVGAEPFAPTFSERWSLSLNGPVARLREDSA